MKRILTGFNVCMTAVCVVFAVLCLLDGVVTSAVSFVGIGVLSVGSTVLYRMASPDDDPADGLSRVCIDMPTPMLDELCDLAEQHDCDVVEFMRRAAGHYRQACLDGRVVVPAGPECSYCDLPKDHDGEHASW